MFLALFLACFFAIFNLFSRLDHMDQQYNNLQNSVNNVTHSVNSQIGSISSRVEEILKSQNDLTADYNTKVDSTNLLVNRVTFSVYAVPKAYVDGMRVEFFADYGGTEPIPGSCRQSEERFYGEIKCPLSDSIALTAVFLYPDGTRQTQLLDTYYDLYSETLPSVDVNDDLMWQQLSEGNMLNLTDQSHGRYVWTQARLKSGAAAVSSVQVGLFKNQKLVAWAEPCEKPDSFHGFEDCSFYLLSTAKLSLTSEDLLQVAAVVTDEYGRIAVSPGSPHCIDKDDMELTRPSTSSLDSDPANWEF